MQPQVPSAVHSIFFQNTAYWIESTVHSSPFTKFQTINQFLPHGINYHNPLLLNSVLKYFDIKPQTKAKTNEALTRFSTADIAFQNLVTKSILKKPTLLKWDQTNQEGNKVFPPSFLLTFERRTQKHNQLHQPLVKVPNNIQFPRNIVLYCKHFTPKE